MRRCLLIALFPLLCHAADLPPPKLADAPPPPPVPDRVVEGGNQDEEVEVRIVESEKGTVTEYRSRGRLYMVKVTPKVGLPYILVDREGKGNFTRSDSPANGTRISVPQWTLFEF